MVTYLQFYRAVKSFYYRNSLLDNLSEIETTIANYLIHQGFEQLSIPGYSIMLSNDKPVVKKIPLNVLNQLELELNKKEVIETENVHA